MAERTPVKSEILRDPRGRPMIKDARIIWRNFAGAEKQFNLAGKRNVTLVLNQEMFDELTERDGFTCKVKEPRTPDEEPLMILPIKINYSPTTRDPRLVMITSGGRTMLDGNTVAALDFVRLSRVDLVLNPYPWKMNEGKPNETSGIAAYLEQGYFTLDENEFEAEYNQLPDADGKRTDTEYNDEVEAAFAGESPF